MARMDEITEATRSVLARYEHDLYDARDLSLVPELLAEPMVRRDAGGKVSVMSNAECRTRISGFFDSYTKLTFRTIHLIVEGPVASWTYDLTLIANDGTKTEISSIETFLVTDAKISEVWNAEYTAGPWA